MHQKECTFSPFTAPVKKQSINHFSETENDCYKRIDCVPYKNNSNVQVDNIDI